MINRKDYNIDCTYSVDSTPDVERLSDMIYDKNKKIGGGIDLMFISYGREIGEEVLEFFGNPEYAGVGFFKQGRGEPCILKQELN